MRPFSHNQADDSPQTWRERLAALRNLPPLLAMVWETSRVLTVLTLLLRCISASIPLATLWVSKLIIDLVVRAIRHQPYDRATIWKLLLLELLLAIASDALGRAITLVDSLLGDRFTNHVSLKLMAHGPRSIWFPLKIQCFTTRWSEHAGRPRHASARLQASPAWRSSY